MTTPEERVAELEAAVAALRAEMAELRQAQAPSVVRSADAPNGRMSRRGMLFSAGAAAAGVAAGSLVTGGSTPALAADGGNLVIGQTNTGTVGGGITELDGSVTTGPALRVTNYNGAAVDAYSDAFQAYTYGAGFAAVYGRNDATGGAAVNGYSANGLGGQFSGGLAPLWLVPSAAAGAPGTTNHNPGEIYVDSTGAFYISQGTSSPVWNRINSVVPIPNVRVINTRPSHQIGPVAGPINNNVTNTWTLAGSNGIPSTAIAVVGNVTAADATGGCFLAVVPSGANHTGVSTVNFPALAAGSGVANAFTVGLSNGAIDIYTGNCSSYTVNIIVDIVGYIV
jgi:hypothetical protein